MNPPTEADPSPRLHICHVTIKRWHNRSMFHDEPLIAPKFLAEIDDAFERCRAWMLKETLPTLDVNHRLVRGTLDKIGVVLEGTFSEWDIAKRQFDGSLTTLHAQWDEVLNEAQKRLHRKFRQAEYPDPSALDSIWKTELKWDETGSASSLMLLKEYSVFYTPPPQFNILDAIAYTHELGKKWPNPTGKRKVPPSPLPRTET